MFSNLLFIFLQILLIECQEEDGSNFFFVFFSLQLNLCLTDIPVVEGNGGPLKIQVEDDVQVLTSENFDLVVLSKPLILVEFYAEWCHHCKQLAPEYSRAAKLLKEDNIPLAKVDAIREEPLAKRFQVQSCPLFEALFEFCSIVFSLFSSNDFPLHEWHETRIRRRENRFGHCRVYAPKS